MLRNLKKKRAKSSVVSIALMLFASHAGGGFASGNQVNTWFVGLGSMGILSSIIAVLILCFMLRQAFIMYNREGHESYKDFFKSLYSPFDKLYLVFELFFNIMVVMVIATTISGASNALLDFVGINYRLASILVSLLILILSIFGADLVRRLSAVMGIIILISSLSIYLIGIPMGDNIFELISYDLAVHGYKNLGPAVVNGFVYAGFQCVQIPAMLAVSSSLKTKDEASRSMALSFAINALALGLSVVMLLSWRSYYMSVDFGTTLPTLTATKAMGYKWMSIFYALSLILCLISSGVSIIFGFVSRFENTEILCDIGSVKVRRFLIAAFIIAVSTLISFFGLTNIIKYGYGYCGYIAIIFIIIPIIVIGEYRNRKVDTNNYAVEFAYVEKKESEENEI
ncbi:hypothetical protein [uncultured Anaerococcus sp.]|uniref:hypothetical protein n=1 Tax=uncultured Anaerococcus sp. TaxID=293428 RepID=UPI00260EB81D|nr:hypothetical protein [uncultured Anaerococcus sp.]